MADPTETTLDHGADVVRGTLLERHGDMIVLGLSGTDYRLHLQTDGGLDADVGKPIAGRIAARARRVDRVRRGGRFVEPLYGRPRRLQGTIVATDDAANALTVRCGGACPFVCTLTAGQRAADFTVGALVGFDVERGAGFESV